jgi:hypothetical protein
VKRQVEDTDCTNCTEVTETLLSGLIVFTEIAVSKEVLCKWQ